MSAVITHEQLSARLQELQWSVAAEVLHGALTGLACAGIAPERPEWAACLVDCTDSDTAVEEHAAMLSALQVWVARDLADSDLQFQLLLPDSEEFLSVRTRALARWSDSFLYAFVASGLILTPEDRELLTDIAAISQVDDGEAGDGNDASISALNNPEDADSNERDFFELCEYVRMAALDLYREHVAPAVSEKNGESST